ncbi:MAG: hypothetical protein K6A41_10715 [Bacteroidales bacterium]|nr:hypothetical protein [Bacteroidales bacterium]
MRYFIVYFLPVAAAGITLLSLHDRDLVFGTVFFLLIAEWLLFFLHKKLKNNAKEYLSGYACKVLHFFPWVERRVNRETRYDSNGRSYTVEVEEFINHPDEYYELYNIDYQPPITGYEFERMCDRWGTGINYFDTNHPNCVRGGGGEECDWDGNEYSTYTATITHRYNNPLVKSNSIFRNSFISKKKSKELGLFEYPSARGSGEQMVILLHEGVAIPEDFDNALGELQRLNAFCGDIYQIHVFILLFPADKGIQMASLQRDYWKGLNKNELVVCLGVNGQNVQWCEAMSWSDNKTLELKIRSYFIDKPELNLSQFVVWLRSNLNYWKRKEFKDFDYLKKGKPSRNYWIWLTISFVISILFVVFLLRYR